MSLTISDAVPCACGRLPKVVPGRPEGRIGNLYRIACSCGRMVPRLSVSVPAAIRVWNRIMADEDVAAIRRDGAVDDVVEDVG